MKITKFIPLFLLFSLGIFLTGCKQSQATVDDPNGASITSVQVTSAPGAVHTFDFPVSDPGFTTITGELLVLSPDVMLPAENDAIFLVPIDSNEMVSGVPVFEVGKVPQATVDETTGRFVFNNISTGQYMVMVLTMSQSQIPPRNYENEGFSIVNITDQDKDKTIDLGYLRFP